MNVVIPPLFFYVVGALLVIFGALRTFTLGRRNADKELSEDTPQAAKARKRHRTFGIVWILMGLFLIVSTADVLRLRH
ncbi:MAG TPA: hypothetical protein VLT58_14990 [Polyangia bacterium]|nr:hypothetical protein [Polyangia bacterium]